MGIRKCDESSAATAPSSRSTPPCRRC